MSLCVCETDPCRLLTHSEFLGVLCSRLHTPATPVWSGLRTSEFVGLPLGVGKYLCVSVSTGLWWSTPRTPLPAWEASVGLRLHPLRTPTSTGTTDETGKGVVVGLQGLRGTSPACSRSPEVWEGWFPARTLPARTPEGKGGTSGGVRVPSFGVLSYRRPLRRLSTGVLHESGRGRKGTRGEGERRGSETRHLVDGGLGATPLTSVRTFFWGPRPTPVTEA